MADEVLTERRGRTLIITINRPEARNAINSAVSHALAAAVEELDADDDLSLAVLTGAGGNFCAGMDLKAFVAGENVLVPGRGLGFTEGPPRKPIISAVEGFALAGGTELVLATDLWWRRPKRSSVSRRSSEDWLQVAADCCACPSGFRTRRLWNWR